MLSSPAVAPGRERTVNRIVDVLLDPRSLQKELERMVVLDRCGVMERSITLDTSENIRRHLSQNVVHNRVTYINKSINEDARALWLLAVVVGRIRKVTKKWLGNI
jgi:hypothetical protein